MKNRSPPGSAWAAPESKLSSPASPEHKLPTQAVSQTLLTMQFAEPGSLKSKARQRWANIDAAKAWSKVESDDGLTHGKNQFNWTKAVDHAVDNKTFHGSSLSKDMIDANPDFDIVLSTIMLDQSVLHTIFLRLYEKVQGRLSGDACKRKLEMVSTMLSDLEQLLEEHGSLTSELRGMLYEIIFVDKSELSSNTNQQRMERLLHCSAEERQELFSQLSQEDKAIWINELLEASTNPAELLISVLEGVGDRVGMLLSMIDSLSTDEKLLLLQQAFGSLSFKEKLDLLDGLLAGNSRERLTLLSTLLKGLTAEEMAQLIMEACGGGLEGQQMRLDTLMAMLKMLSGNELEQILGGLLGDGATTGYLQGHVRSTFIDAFVGGLTEAERANLALGLMSGLSDEMVADILFDYFKQLRPQARSHELLANLLDEMGAEERNKVLLSLLETMSLDERTKFLTSAVMALPVERKQQLVQDVMQGMGIEVLIPPLVDLINSMKTEEERVAFFKGMARALSPAELYKVLVENLKLLSADELAQLLPKLMHELLDGMDLEQRTALMTAVLVGGITDADGLVDDQLLRAMLTKLSEEVLSPTQVGQCIDALLCGMSYEAQCKALADAIVHMVDRCAAVGSGMDVRMASAVIGQALDGMQGPVRSAVLQSLLAQLDEQEWAELQKLVNAARNGTGGSVAAITNGRVGGVASRSEAELLLQLADDNLLEIERAVQEHKALRLADMRSIGQHKYEGGENMGRLVRAATRKIVNESIDSKPVQTDPPAIAPHKFMDGDGATMIVKRWFVSTCTYMNSDGLLDGAPLPYALPTHRDIIRFACELGVRHFVQFLHKEPEEDSYAARKAQKRKGGSKNDGKSSSSSSSSSDLLSAVPKQLLKLRNKLSAEGSGSKNSLGHNYDSFADVKFAESVLEKTIGLPHALLQMAREQDPSVPSEDGEAVSEAVSEAVESQDDTDPHQDCTKIVNELFASQGEGSVLAAVLAIQSCFRRHHGLKGSIVGRGEKSATLQPVLAMLFGYLHGMGPRSTGQAPAGSVEAVATECRAEMMRLAAALGSGDVAMTQGNTEQRQQLPREQLHGLHRQLRLLRGQAIDQAELVRNAHLQYLQITPFAIGATFTSLLKKVKKAKKSRHALPDIDIGGWKRFGKKPPKNVKMKKLSLNDALLLIYDCYAKKIKADEADDKSAVGESQRQSLNDFIVDFLVTKYGLKNVAESYLYGLVHTLLRHEKKGA
jgi:hypothetical protein